MKATSTALFFLCVFVAFLTPMELGGIWWHLSTGEWIIRNLSIPAADPFTFTSDPSRDNSFVLSAFWLCDLILSLFNRAGGLYALIALKAALFTSSAFVLWKGAMAQGANRTVSFLCLLPSVFIFTFYDEIRPQTFTLLFFSITLYVLEGERLKRAPSPTSGPYRSSRIPGPGLILLMVIMPLWSNIHPGFVIGPAFILLYMAEHVFTAVRSKKSAPVDTALLLSLTAAVALSALNPNGIEAFGRTLSMLSASARGTAKVHEHFGIREFAEFTGMRGHIAAIYTLTALGLLSFAGRRRRPDILHAFIFVSMTCLSFITFRAGIFLAAAAVPVIGRNFPGLSIPAAPRIRQAASMIAVLSLISAAAALGTYRSVMTQPVLSRGVFPDKALAYIENAGLPPNLFHPYEWGGYVIWRLFPKYKAFIDSRGLIQNDDYFVITNAGPGWQETLERRGVNTVVFWAILPYEKRVPPIVFALIRDQGWDAAYWDSRSLIFVRTGMAEHTLRKTTVWELLESLATANIMLEPDAASNHIALGEILMQRGLRDKAREALKMAVQLEPGNLEARKLLGHLESSGL